ncbi:hypothetical protein [Mycoplasmopsis synoviae]|uniref:Uncharacterized protein n=1 Tax=Mycoplasmopsis synoviae TaxID=2109 RepID=A0AAX3F036_MYCSY|nr:hypothetical protein [Mycoplasmopsis synoviae]UZW64353.1 hypothetical protein OIE46_03215 [Mycoplasmopsis synoviae]
MLYSLAISFVGILTFRTKALIKKSYFGKNVIKLADASKKTVSFFNKSIQNKILDSAKFSIAKIAKDKTVSQNFKNVINSQNLQKIIKNYNLTKTALKNPVAATTSVLTNTAKKQKAEIAKVLTKLEKKQITAGLQKQLQSGTISPSAANRYVRFIRTKQNRWIELFATGRSSWLRGIRVYSEEFYNQTKDITFMLYFEFSKTGGKLDKLGKITKKGKLPLELNLTYSEFFNFLNAESMGRFYLQNIAWGSVLGKKNIFDGTSVFLNKNLSIEEIKRRFRLLDADKTIAGFGMYREEVLKHRTNKNQVLAFWNPGDSHISFSRSAKNINKNYITKISNINKKRR